jgi:hypothetical protein
LTEFLPKTAQHSELQVDSLVEQLLRDADNHIAQNRLMDAETVLKRCYDSAPDNPEVTQRLFKTYQDNLRALKRSPYLDYPLFVHMETQTICNARCSFCPYPKLERLGTKMPNELIDKIISDLEDIPRNVAINFAPFKVSDPFAEPRLYEIIAKINKRLPNASISLYSNGASITPAKLEALRKVENFAYLNISLNEHRKEEYESLMGIKFEHTIARLKYIHEQLEKTRLPFPVVISRVCDYKNDEDFRSWIAERFPLFHVHTHRRTDWIGQTDTECQAVPNIGCTMWFSLSIMSTGVVAYCCMDGEGQHPIGDVSKQHALEIYNAPHFRAVRENYETRIGGTPCGQCTFF